MRTIVCSFRFADGASAKATLSVDGPENFDPISYSGAYERLATRERASAAGIELWAQDAAASAGAKLSIRRRGRFDHWAR